MNQIQGVTWRPPMTLKHMKVAVVTKALELCDGNKTHAAAMLGVSLRSIRIWIVEFKLIQFYGGIKDLGGDA